jgi:S1-C subfamily serine protease
LPAAQAGLQPRDVVTKIDDKDVTDDSAFAKIINSYKPGDTITLTVLRGKQTLELKAKLIERPSS